MFSVPATIIDVGERTYDTSTILCATRGAREGVSYLSSLVYLSSSVAAACVCVSVRAENVTSRAGIDMDITPRRTDTALSGNHSWIGSEQVQRRAHSKRRNDRMRATYLSLDHVEAKQRTTLPVNLKENNDAFIHSFILSSMSHRP